VPRWEHGSEERLKQAAMALFDEQGFQNTSAVQIAERARVTTRTFFRYFPDKQAILFVDADRLAAELIERIRDSPDGAEPLAAVMTALAGFDWLSLGAREFQRRRDEMIAANPGLLERELIKQHQMADGFTAALCQRGVDPDIAELAARVGIQVFRTAYRQWLASDDDDADLTVMVETALSVLTRIAST
jgi:AcrR family transcriptional regulator